MGYRARGCFPKSRRERTSWDFFSTTKVSPLHTCPVHTCTDLNCQPIPQKGVEHTNGLTYYLMYMVGDMICKLRKDVGTPRPLYCSPGGIRSLFFATKEKTTSTIRSASDATPDSDVSVLSQTSKALYLRTRTKRNTVLVNTTSGGCGSDGDA